MAARIDITGQRFGKVVVLRECEPRIYKSGEKKSQFLCRCDCGNEFKTTSNMLRRGDTTSCGCSHEINLVGQRFGKLTVVERIKVRNDGKPTKWKCVCDCGNTIIIEHSKLKNRNNPNCGCEESVYGKRSGILTAIAICGRQISNNGKWKNLVLCKCDCGNYTIIELNSLNRQHTKSCGCLYHKHDMAKTRPHQIWASMRKRVHNPNCKAYKNYGGRGIEICQEWDDDTNGFVNFWKWAQNNGYSDELTLDRIDVNGDYSPGNCRWTTRIEQARNTRKNLMLTYKGETKCLKEWSEILGINYGTLQSRICRDKWSVEKAFETPVNANKRRMLPSA